MFSDGDDGDLQITRGKRLSISSITCESTILDFNTGVLRPSSPRACDDTGKSNDLARRRATEKRGASPGKALSRAGACDLAPASVGWCKDNPPLWVQPFRYSLLMPCSSRFAGKR
jgi:hypothetical protein